MSRAGTNGPAPGRRPAPPPNPPAPASVRMWWDGGDRAITAREKATIEEHGPSCFSIALVPATPSARWAADGLPDPHAGRYACERGALTLGNLTDDELANAVYLHGNEQPSMADLVAGKALSGIVYLTAAKDRIRWLSRALAATCKQPLQVGEVQGDALPPMPKCHDRQPDDMPGYMESALDWTRDPDNCEAVEWLMENHAAIRAALAARQPGAQEPVAGPYLDEPDAPSNPLWKRLRSIANWLTVLAPDCHMEAAELLLTASARIQRNDAAPPAQGIDPAHVEVIESLLQVAYAAFVLADDTEDDGDSMKVPRSDFYALSAALDRLDELPDDQPGYVMECAAKARWALRGLIDQRDAAPGVGS